MQKHKVREGPEKLRISRAMLVLLPLNPDLHGHISYRTGSRLSAHLQAPFKKSIHLSTIAQYRGLDFSN